MTARIIELEVVDHGVGGEYGLFGKVVCKAKVDGMTEAELEAEKAELRAMHGDHVAIREVELVPAVDRNDGPEGLKELFRLG